MKLTKKLYCTWIHGKTGREVETLTLPAGTEISEIRSSLEETFGGRPVGMEAPQEGETWTFRSDNNLYKAWVKPEVE